MKLATIIGQNGEIITLGTGNNGRGDRVLYATSKSMHRADDFHPHSKPYQRGTFGTAQAICDIENMYKSGPWNLEFSDFAVDFVMPTDFNGRNGYTED